MFSLKGQFRILLFLELTLIAALFWPGEMTPDSFGQLEMALRHTYSDHHPPMMSVVWGWFLPLHVSPFWMLLLHLAVMGVGIDYLGRLSNYSRITWMALCIPLFPQILVYSGFIWKDVSMATSFFAVACILTFHTVNKSKLSLLEILAVLLLMGYGAAVKYQGQFCVVPLCLWLIYPYFKTWWGYAFKGLVLWLAVFGFVQGVNDYYVPPSKKSHSWQYVKLFDMAAISVSCGEDLLPAAYKTSFYSFEALKALTNHQRVDDLVFGEKAILRISHHPQDQAILKQEWFQAILNHPVSYFIHRMWGSLFIYGSIPGYSRYLELIEPYAMTHPFMFKALNGIGKMVGFILLAHTLLPFFALFYFYKGIRGWRASRFSIPLVFSSGCSLLFLLMGILFFMSMAGTPRYTYLCALLIAHCHLMAYFLCKERKLALLAA